MKTTLLIIALPSLVWLSGCSAAPSVAPAKTVAEPTVAPASAAGALEVTYLANEGFMIAGGGRKVLIDVLFRESSGNYAAPSPATRELLETGCA